MNPRRTTAAFLAVCGVSAVHATGVFAQAPVFDARDLDERLKRIERLLGSESLLKLFDEVESLGTEVRELRGQTGGCKRTRSTSSSSASARTLSRRRPATSAHRIRIAPTQAAGASPAAESRRPRPRLHVHGDGRSEPAEPLRRATTPTTQTSPTTGVDPFAEQQAYQGAFDLLKSGRYEDAAVAFQQFIAAYPTGSYADNAQYWLGETYLHHTPVRVESVQEFQRLVSTHPNSQKITHAMLKIGYAQDELGNKAEAERVLGDLIEESSAVGRGWPCTKAAREHPPVADACCETNGRSRLPDGAVTPGASIPTCTIDPWPT